MGLFSGIKKLVKGVGKVFKKVVKGIARLGKKIIKGVGKFIGKIGPVGMLAVSVIAPYALGALAGAGMGWVSTAAQKAIEFGSMVKSAVAAPFKLAGQAIGKGAQALGQSIGGGFQTITDKIASTLGAQGSGSISEGARSIFGDVANSYNKFMGNTPTLSNLGQGEVTSAAMESVKGSAFDISKGVEFSGSQAPSSTIGSEFMGKVDAFASAGKQMTSEELLAATATSTPADLTIDNQKMSGLTEAERMSFDEAPTSLFDRMKKGLSNFGVPSTTLSPTGPSQPASDGYDQVDSAGGQGGAGTGGLGRSFHAQELTGLDPTEEFARMAAQGLFGQHRGMA